MSLNKLNPNKTLTFIFLFSLFSLGQASARSIATSTICKSLSSVNVYTASNLLTMQKNLQNFFPKMVTTGVNDKQNKFYIRQYQFAFGLYPTGVFDYPTLKLLKTQNKCFDIAKKVENIEKAKIINQISKEELMYQILFNNVYATSTN